MKKFAVIKTYYSDKTEEEVILAEKISAMERSIVNHGSQRPFDVLGYFDSKEELREICTKNYEDALGALLKKRLIDIDVKEHWEEAKRLIKEDR